MILVHMIFENTMINRACIIPIKSVFIIKLYIYYRVHATFPWLVIADKRKVAIFLFLISNVNLSIIYILLPNIITLLLSKQYLQSYQCKNAHLKKNKKSMQA